MTDTNFELILVNENVFKTDYTRRKTKFQTNQCK